MVKDFKSWSQLKQRLDAKQRKVYFKEKEIWWCSIGLNIGFEENGKGAFFRRPVLILKKFSNDIFLSIPLTSKHKVGSWYMKIVFDNNVDILILSQIRVLDVNRLESKMGKLEGNQFELVKRKLYVLLEM